MGQIKNYTAKLGSGGGGSAGQGTRRATAEDFGASSGLDSAVRGIHRFQDGLEGFLTDMEADEARKGQIANAELRTQFSQRLDAAATNGEDLDTIREDFDNQRDAIGEEFQTRKGKETSTLHGLNSTGLFEGRMNDIKVSRAVTDMKAQGSALLNNVGEMVSKNPAYLPQSVLEIKAFVATFAGRIPPDKLAAMERDLIQNMNMAAAVTTAHNDPQLALKQLAGDTYDLEPAQRAQITAQADRTIKMRASDARSQRAEARAQRAETDRIAYGEGVRAIMEGKWNSNDALKDGRLSGSSLASLQHFQDSRTREMESGQQRSDPATKKRLWLGVTAKATDPSKINGDREIREALAAGKLNTEDAQYFVNLQQQGRDPQGQTLQTRMNMATQLVGAGFRNNPELSTQPRLLIGVQTEYITAVDEAVALAKEKGDNPLDLFNPRTKGNVVDASFLASVEARAKVEFYKQQQEEVTAAVTKGWVVGVTVQDGHVWMGGPPELETSWVPVTGTAPPKREATGEITPVTGEITPGIDASAP